MKTIYIFLFTAILFCAGTDVQASNIQIDSMPKLIANGAKANIVFNLSWEYSWRLKRPYNNWDAAWVFAKYKDASNTWKPVYLDESGHSVVNQNGVVPEFKTGTSSVGGGNQNVGMFIYRSAIGSGNIDWRGVTLSWSYRNQGVGSLSDIEIDVFALEMVYIPEASYYLGSGSYTTPPAPYNWVEQAAFCYANDSKRPYLVESEDPILLSNDVTKTTALGSRSGSGAGLWLTSGETTNEASLPAAFPKGYKAFYSMKYELTQEAYKDFLNCLEEPQQLLRAHIASLVAAENKYVFPSPSISRSYRNGIMLIKTETGTYKFVCNYRWDNSISLEEDADRNNDGQNIAMNYLSLDDALAYMDWSGLRPLSELEYEKMARGTKDPLVNEIAWGTTYYLACGNPDNTAYMAGTGKETPNQGNYNNTGYPIRSGSFANATTSRAKAGAGFYGNMELAGNVSERYINIHYNGAHSFTALHGDGVLEIDGKASTTDLLWPIAAQHYIFRGGGGGSHTSTSLSDRYFYSSGRTNITADYSTGMRAGRTVE